MNKSDEELIKQYQQGNEEAWEMLYVKYKKPVFNFAWRLLENRADAEDIAADIFLKLFKDADRFNPIAKFSTWLFTITRNACISSIRKRKKTFSLSFRNKKSGKDEIWEFPDERDKPDEVVEKKDQAKFVKRAISRLPHNQKEVIILREYHDMSYMEISEVLALSLENVKILIFRSRETLRKELRDLS